MENYRLWFMRRLRNGNRVAFGTAPAGLCVGVLLVLGFARTSFGDPMQFTLNTAQSTLKLTGQVASPLGPATLKPQVTGSDAATYSGFILADLSAGSIQFPGGSSLAANNFVGGALTPDNPANYGMKATIFISTANATVINLVFDLGSGALAVAPDGTFPANMGTSATVTSGIIDYVAPPPYGNGSDSLAGSTASNQAATSATLAIVGQTQTLTIPINATIPFYGHQHQRFDRGLYWQTGCHQHAYNPDRRLLARRLGRELVDDATDRGHELAKGRCRRQ